MATNNVPSFRYPFEGAISKLPPEHQEPLRALFNSVTDLYQANATNSAKVQALAPATSTASTSSTSSAVTSAQAAAIASTQAATTIATTFGTVNPQAGTAYTTQTSDYAGLVTFNSASAVAATLNSTVAMQWFTAMENLGAGTVTVTPDTGLINGLASIPLVTGAGALIYRNPDGTNWSALTIPAPSIGGGVTSIDGITGAVSLIAGTGITITDNTPSAGDITIAASAAGVASLQGETGAITLTSSGSTVAITTPSGSVINLEATGGGSGLPINNPTFTGVLTGPTANINHLEVTGTTPGIALHGAAGSGATVTIGGNDTAGLINITAGSGASAGFIATITLAAGFPTATLPLANGFSNATSVLESFAAFGISANTWDLNAGFAMTAGQVYTIQYIVFGN